MPKRKPSKPVERKPQAIKKFLVDQVPKHPRDLVQITMTRFHLTRPAVHRHLEKLIADGAILKEGSRNTTVYKLPSTKAGITWSLSLGKEGDEGEVWQRDFAPKIASYPRNIQDICYYGVTEMINNAIDHSLGKRLTLSWNDQGSEIQIMVRDDGIGIFKKISDSLGLTDPREAILHLTKGKFTTDSKNHTGQGIFFTSRMFDSFAIMSHELVYVRTRAEDDWLVESRKESNRSGTTVQLALDKHTKLNTIDVFRSYEDDDHGFDKTDVFVKLAKLEEETYISRSQARRLLLGLDKFTSVILDFSDVRSVGQGFVDEVFRVYKNAHPEVKISYVNANDDVEFMIRRGLSDAKESL
jgi:anti-sigma regulatory factor (Ser/Thr protein kinase)